jgi:hypothetical protein
MKTRETLLNRLLQTLVDEWGHEKVAAALARTVGSSNDPSAERPPNPKIRPSGKGARPSATAQIERAALEGEQKDALLQLAVRYDSKQFLPSVADVREFLIMMGERPIDMKDRKEAFRIRASYNCRSSFYSSLPVPPCTQVARNSVLYPMLLLLPVSACRVSGNRNRIDEQVKWLIPRRTEASTCLGVSANPLAYQCPPEVPSAGLVA